MFDKIRNTLIATSVLYLIFGVIMLFLPDMVIKSVCYLIGIMFLFVGVSGVVMYMKTDIKTAFTSFTLVMAIIFGAFGIYVLLNPETFASFLPLVVGIFLLVDSVSKLSMAFDLKKFDYKYWWQMLIVAFILLGCGLLLVFNPFEALTVSVQIIGAILVVDAISNIFTIYSYSKVNSIKEAEIHEK